MRMDRLSSQHSLQTHDRSGFQPFPVLCPGAPHCRPTLICSARSVPTGPAAHDGPSPSFPCTCRHWAGKMQGKVDVQVGTTRIHKFSCCQDVIVPLLLGKVAVPLRFWLSTRLLDMKQDTADRFMRDPIRGCHCTERFVLLHHTLHHGRPVGSRKTVCWLLWPWPPLLDHRRRRACLSWFLRSLADVAPSDTVCQMGQGRGKKLVTEDPKPVGSGRFREQTRDAEAVPGLFLALLIRDLPPSVSLLCELDPIWWKTKIVTLPRFGGVLRGEN